ncbi:MAG: 3-deoxy-D-manno-octulosonic acid transferase [Prevotellaceae bacterium]|nr:3-deoxy-D-manno-octulosonic acid transferase [Prevotellaceae bacterium]
MLLYTLGIYLYALGVVLASPFYRKARLMVKGRFNAYRTLRAKVEKGARYVWFHAASLGEFEQGRPLMERLRSEHPEFKILLTFFSPSGYEVRKHYDGADIICYLPFDTYGNVLSFFRLVKPEMAFFIKYEFWMNYILGCRLRKIPVYSVSSLFRPDKVFFHWYGWAYAKVLRCVTHFFVQDQQSLELLRRKGIESNVTVVGDTRFDRVTDICREAKQLPLLKAFKQGGLVLVAGSTWPPDEELLISYFNAHPELRLVIAPHVVSESRLRHIEGMLRRPSVRYHEANNESARNAEALIIDGYGLLSSVYRYGEIAYVGGGFGAGIHNVPEAAVYGVPVLIGPNNKGFAEALALLRLGGCFEVRDQESLNETMHLLTSDPEALSKASDASRSYIQGNAGAADAIFRKLGL